MLFRFTRRFGVWRLPVVCRVLQVGLVLAMGVMLQADPAPTGAVPEYLQWATITHPGNEPYPTPPPPFSQYPYPPGRVDYVYQISRTEVTGAEWLEFVQAYGPYVDPSLATSTLFVSQRIEPIQTAPGQWSYALRPGGANRAVRVGWRFAARYVNWLHNDKCPEQAAFEGGVYDTSTFGGNPKDGFTDQLVRSPGARCFIPTIDEWVKGGYWDPERPDPLGRNLGYWQFPNTSDEQLNPGPAGVGETSAGCACSEDVGAYNDVRSPWGLWDLSGGQFEWLETASVRDDGRLAVRFIKGTTSPSSPAILYQDGIDWLGGGVPDSLAGIRLARRIMANGDKGTPPGIRARVVQTE